MNFAVPAALWGLPLVAVPIIIHLLQRRRTRKVDFAAMRFLAEALRRTRRRVLMEDMLLLMLRTLAVLALVLALARPSTESLPFALGREARAEVLLVDASLSMDHRQGGASSFERARAVAVERLAGLEGDLDDRASLLRAGLGTERLASGDPREVRKAVEEMTAPQGGSSDLAAGVLAARQTMLDLGLPLDRIRVTLLTDLQATQWPQDAPALAALERLAELGGTVEVVDCGADLRANLGVTALTLTPAQLVQGDTVEASFTVRNYSSEPVDRELSVTLDGELIATRQVVLGPQEELQQAVLLHPVTLGPRVVEVQLPHDGLVGDDRRAAVLEVRDSLRVLLVGELALEEGTPGLVETLDRYLSLGPEAPIQAEKLPLTRLDASALEDADLLLLADPGLLNLSQADLVAGWVSGGGSLLLFPGPITGQVEAENLLAAVGAAELRVGEVARPGAEDAARLEIADAELPALRFFADPRWQPLLTEVPFLSYRPLWLEAETVQDFDVGLRFQGGGDGDAGAALVLSRHGRGQVAVSTAAPLPGWNRMEEVPGGTLPLLFDLLFQLSPPPSHPSTTPFGAPLTLALPDPATEIALRDPQGLRRSLAPSALGSAAQEVTLLERANRAGVWEVEARLLRPDGAEDLRRDHFAVVNPPLESDLRPASRALLAGSLPANVQILRPEELDDEAPPGEDGSRQLTELLLFAMLAFLVGETMLAAALDRRRMGA
ncbi:MAG: BatA domain-containing protein [Planctomycetota bacterium]|jgi:hypothetical protein